jgi:hypothetical protein
MSDSPISLSAEAQRRRQLTAQPTLSVRSAASPGSIARPAPVVAGAGATSSAQSPDVALFNQAVQKMDQVFNNLPTIAVVQF